MTQIEKIRELASRIGKHPNIRVVPIEKINGYMGELKQIESLKIRFDASMIGPTIAIDYVRTFLQNEIDRRLAAA